MQKVTEVNFIYAKSLVRIACFRDGVYTIEYINLRTRQKFAKLVCRNERNNYVGRKDDFLPPCLLRRNIHGCLRTRDGVFRIY